jgi:hypothetical protein
MAVMGPRNSPLVSQQEAVQRAERQGDWQPHPARDAPDMACVTSVAHVWEGGAGALQAGVRRDGRRKKPAVAHLVVVTTDHRLTGPWMVRHSAERPEIAQAYHQRQRGGWQRQQLRATRSRAIVFDRLTVVVSSRLSHLFCHTRAGARGADKTRHALACEPLRSRRTPMMASAEGHVDIFATLRVVHRVLQLPATVQKR